MKKFLLWLSAIGMIATACQTDDTSDNAIGVGEGTLLSVSLEQTRTSLGEKLGDTYPYYWSEGDQIVVNGKLSDEVMIDAENRSRATFKFSKAVLSTPYYITYPHCASTTTEKPIVEFPAEQEYVKGTFSSGSSPMCGYVENKSDIVSLNHLSAILRLPLKAAYDGVILEKVVVTAENNIAGEFAVNCQTTEISATESCGNVITYTLPANFVLSTTTPSDLFISLPAVEVGACTIEFVPASGEKMVANWAPNKPLSKGVVREFKTITYQPKTTISLQPLTSEDDEFTIFYKNLSGYVRYSDGSPIANVAVSDGFQVVATDANGHYELKGVTRDTWYIYCSLPNDVVVPTNEYGMPCFFKKYVANTKQYDFTFEKLPNGPEQEFVLFALADTQVNNSSAVSRFNAQATPEIKAYAHSMNVHCYGIALGDIIYSTPNHNDEYLLYEMREVFDVKNIGIPIFTVFGNHDNAYYCEHSPVFPDSRNSTFNLKIQRPYEDCFGPVDYSFNRGNAHIISMRNMQYISNMTPWPEPSDFELKFTEKQLHWIEQDLALVPKDKSIILCVHVPIFNKTNDGLQEVLYMLDTFNNSYILSGHLHYRRCYDHSKLSYSVHKSFEQSWSSAHGTGWSDNVNINCDGAPIGYGVITFKDGLMTKSIHKGFSYGMNDPDYQIRLHRGKDITGAEISGTNNNETKGYYQFGFDENTILANIFSSDPWNWTVEVWSYDEESGEKIEKLGNMTQLYNCHDTPIYDDLVGTGTLEDPRRPAEGVVSGRDFWTAGVLLGHLGLPSKYRFWACFTMWSFSLDNPDTKVMVVARDRWGNEFTQTEFQVGTDTGYAIYDPANNPK